MCNCRVKVVRIALGGDQEMSANETSGKQDK
nr:MAG TPA_asm: hypothetical protein [Bacteriophage sp.]